MDALSREVVTFVLNSLWQVALVAAAAMFADLLLRRGPARYRHVLWVGSLAVAVAVPLISMRPQTQNWPAVIASSAGVLPDDGSQLTIPGGGIEGASQSGWWTRLSIASRHRMLSLPPSLARAALALYLVSVAFMLARFVRACVKTRQIRHLASVVDPLPRHVTEALERCRHGLTRRGSQQLPPCPPILLSTRIPGPVTVGVRRPAIILPATLLEPAGREDLTAALAHEMAHICRRDYLWNLIYELLYLPLSFHPLTLLILRRLCDTRELACDELAAQVLSTSTYARSLVRLAHEMSRRAGAALAPNYTLGVFDANILEERVMRLLKPRASGHLARLSLLSAAVLISSLSLAAMRFSIGIAQPAGSAPTRAISGGVSGGVGNGVATGISGSVSGGVAGGTMGGVAGGVSGTTSYAAAGAFASQNEAQDKTGSLAGIVVDSSGARIPNAEVRLVSRNNAFQKSAQSDETGNFSFDEVPAGRYTLEVSSPGMGGTFRSFEFKAEGQPPFFPFVLHPGSVAETVAVTAKSPHTLGDKATKMGPHRIRVGGAVEAAKLIEGAQPAYPEAAKSRGAQGVVVLEATISTGGGIENLKVISSPDDDLTKASLEAVREWRYQPTLLNGDPIEVVTTVAVNFTLQN